MVANKEKVIFIVSNEAWGKQWFIKHHYANELACLGYNVYFINPVSKWSLYNLIRQGVTVKPIKTNLYLVEYNNLFPVRVWPKLMVKLNDWVNAVKLRPLRKGKELVIWQFDAFRFVYNYLRKSKKIYYISDHYHDLPFDLESVKNADLLVCTGKSFMPYYAKFGKSILHVPHAISSDELNVEEAAITLLSETYGEYILHVGSINDRLDISIFYNVLKRFKNTNLLLVGPNKLIDKKNQQLFESCKQYQNFKYLGTVDGKTVKNYVKSAKVCLLVYDFKAKQTLGTVSSSLKVMNYLAQKKPIVSSILIEYENLLDRVIYYGANLTTYLDFIEKGLENQLEVDSRIVDAFLEENKYEKNIHKIFSQV